LLHLDPPVEIVVVKADLSHEETGKFC